MEKEIDETCISICFNNGELLDQRLRFWESVPSVSALFPFYIKKTINEKNYIWIKPLGLFGFNSFLNDKNVFTKMVDELAAFKEFCEDVNKKIMGNMEE